MCNILHFSSMACGVDRPLNIVVLYHREVSIGRTETEKMEAMSQEGMAVARLERRGTLN